MSHIQEIFNIFQKKIAKDKYRLLALFGGNET